MIRASRAQRSFDSSPGLIAVFHALRRLPAPRHPPHALGSLAAPTPPPLRRGKPGRRRYLHRLFNRGAHASPLASRRNDPSLSWAHAENRKHQAPGGTPPELGLVNLQLLPHPELSKNHTWFESGHPHRMPTLLPDQGWRHPQVPPPAARKTSPSRDAIYF